MYSLKINNNSIDLSNDFNVTLTYKSLDLLDPTSRNVGYTYTISIPKTNRNNKAFNYIQDDYVIDKFRNIEYDCILYYNTIEIIKGIFYLDSIDETYNGSIVSDNLNWVKKIPDDSIRNLTGFTVPFPFEDELIGTFNTIQTYTTGYSTTYNSDNSDINFPFIPRGNYNYAEYGQELDSIQNGVSFYQPINFNPSEGPIYSDRATNTKFTYEDIPPSYYYLNSIKNIFKASNLNVECSLFSDQDLKKLVIPYVGKDDFNFNYKRLGRFQSQIITGQTYYTAITFVERYNTFQTPYLYSTPPFNYTNPGYRYIVLEDSNITVTATGLTPSIFGWGIAIKKSSLADSENSELLISAASMSPGFITYTGDFMKNDIIYVNALAGGIRYLEIIPNTGDQELNIQNILPDVKCIDWIKNFINYFGLYPIYNINNNTVYLLTLNEFIIKSKYNLNNVFEKKLTKYTYDTINLKYAVDQKDPLIKDGQFDYITDNKTNIIQNLFAPTGQREYITTHIYDYDTIFSDYIYYFNETEVLLPTIASKDQINLDRLILSRSDIVDYVIWSASTIYDKGDKVYNSERYYTSLISGNSGNSPFNTVFWSEDFLGEYNTDVDFDMTPRILKMSDTFLSYVDGTQPPDLNKIYPIIVSDFNEMLFFNIAYFPDELNMNNVFIKYYSKYNELINNRTSLLEGTAYIPIKYFNQFLNRPVEIHYNSDIYIIIEISNYNPKTERCVVKMIKKITYINFIE